MINKKFIEYEIKRVFPDLSIENIVSTSGGDINLAYIINTNRGNLFMKINSRSNYPQMLKLEMENLNYMRKHVIKLRIPEPLIAFEDETTQYLIMEYIPHGTKSESFWRIFAEGLAEMHKISNDKFGFFYHNYMGSLKQSNTWTTKWTEFFIHQRLLPQVNLAYQNHLLSFSSVKKIEKLYTRLSEILPEEKPSLVHGDLWGGNYFPDENGKPVIYDPACYFGFREVDIAMSKLFGGFDREFYEHYKYFYPLQNGWQDRTELLNLYPLLIHVNLFGDSYVYQVERIISRYV